MKNSSIPFDELNQVDLAMTGFGYGKTQVSPLHMAMITSAIANGGNILKPRIVDRIVNKDNKEIFKAKEKVLSRAIKPEISDEIREMMVDVVNKGTGKAAYLRGLQVAGKTGTADKEDGNVDAWFVGFAPANEPKIAIALVIENSQGTGGEIAAPLARKIIRDIFNTVSFE